MKMQFENSTGRIRNIGQQPWANEFDYLDTTVLDVESVPPNPYYDHLFVDGEYIFDEDLFHPSRVSVQLDATADINIDDIVTRLKAAGIFDKTVAEIYTDIQAQVDAITTLAQAKTFLRQVIPFLGAGVVWIIRRTLRRE